MFLHAIVVIAAGFAALVSGMLFEHARLLRRIEHRLTVIEVQLELNRGE